MMEKSRGVIMIELRKSIDTLKMEMNQIIF